MTASLQKKIIPLGVPSLGMPLVLGIASVKDGVKMPMVNATIEDCHKFGLLHDAVAIVLFDMKDNVLLVLRSRKKFGGGKWEIPATHCFGSGYFPDGYRCLEDEVGVKDVNLDYLGDFHYCVHVGDLIENEIVHVLIAEYDGLVRPNQEHCMDFAWFPLSQIFNDGFTVEASRKFGYAQWQGGLQRKIIFVDNDHLLLSFNLFENFEIINIKGATSIDH